jgi:hypothetical protein
MKKPRRLVGPLQKRSCERRAYAEVDVAVARQWPGDLLDPIRQAAADVQAVLGLEGRGLQHRTRSDEARGRQSFFGQHEDPGRGTCLPSNLRN